MRPPFLFGHELLCARYGFDAALREKSKTGSRRSSISLPFILGCYHLLPPGDGGLRLADGDRVAMIRDELIDAELRAF
jgi:hypothetical protein